MHTTIYKTLCAASLLTLSACAEARDVTVAAAQPQAWRLVPDENLVILKLKSGDVVLELNSDFAPNHVAQFRKYANEGIYDGEAFYRVIDGFVAQGGLETDERVAPYPKLINENDRTFQFEDGSETLGFTPINGPDLFAAEVGHTDGFAVARDESINKEWLLHCPGALAMARDEDPDTGSVEFYIVLDAQRYLDRNLTVFGRVLSGMEHIQALKRGDRNVEGGVIQPPDKGDTILSIRTASALPEDARPHWEVMPVPSDEFETFKTAKRVRNEPFFYRHPPEVLDICGFSVPARAVE